MLRGDHSLNEVKTGKLHGLQPFRFASDNEVFQHLGCRPGFISPLGVDRNKVQVIADRSAACMSNFVCGANSKDKHYSGVNWERDIPEPDIIADIRNVTVGDPSPDGAGKLDICRGIEVGHIFQLGSKYSKIMQCNYLDQAGKEHPMQMGCYGIGVTRIVAAAIEQGHDQRGIIFPAALAPFALVIVPLAAKKSPNVNNTAEDIYKRFSAAGVDVILDDRDQRPGSMLADWELIGVTHRIVIGERGLREGTAEYQNRNSNYAEKILISELLPNVLAKLKN